MYMKGKTQNDQKIAMQKQKDNDQMAKRYCRGCKKEFTQQTLRVW